MARYPAIIQSMAKSTTVAVLFVALIGSYSLLNYTNLPFSIPSLQAASGGNTILNVLPHYDAVMAYDYIASYSQSAIEIYHRILLLDVLVLIPVYVLFLTVALLQTGKLVLRRRGQSYLQFLAVLPSVAAMLNLLEDGIITGLIAAYPVRYEALATFCGYITTAKSVLVVTSFLTITVFAILIGYSRVVYSLGLRKCHI